MIIRVAKKVEGKGKGKGKEREILKFLSFLALQTVEVSQPRG